ncbi:hypothetical protein PsSCT_16120 [Pseudomonas sp. SCT]
MSRCLPHRGRYAADCRSLRCACAEGYVYFAMAFSLGVETLNIRMRKAMKRKLKEPVKLGKGLPD